MHPLIKINLEMPIAKSVDGHTEAAISADVCVEGRKDHCVKMLAAVMKAQPALAQLVVSSTLQYLKGDCEISPIDKELEQMVRDLLKQG